MALRALVVAADSRKYFALPAADLWSCEFALAKSASVGLALSKKQCDFASVAGGSIRSNPPAQPTECTTNSAIESQSLIGGVIPVGLLPVSHSGLNLLHKYQYA